MKQLIPALILAVSEASIFLEVFADGGMDNSDGFSVQHVQSQEECNLLQGDNPSTVFDQTACACFALGQCRQLCDEGEILDPTKTCECISQAYYDLIFNHGLNDKCQVRGFDPSDLTNAGNVNVFNFYGPIYGDVYGFDDGFASSGTEDYDEDDSIDGGDNGDQSYTSYVEDSSSSYSTSSASSSSSSSDYDSSQSSHGGGNRPGTRHAKQAQKGDRCEGIDRSTGELFPACAPGLRCLKSVGEMPPKHFCFEADPVPYAEPEPEPYQLPPPAPFAGYQAQHDKYAANNKRAASRRSYEGVEAGHHARGHHDQAAKMHQKPENTKKHHKSHSSEHEVYYEDFDPYVTVNQDRTSWKLLDDIDFNLDHDFKDLISDLDLE